MNKENKNLNITLTQVEPNSKKSSRYRRSLSRKKIQSSPSESKKQKFGSGKKKSESAGLSKKRNASKFENQQPIEDTDSQIIKKQVSHESKRMKTYNDSPLPDRRLPSSCSKSAERMLVNDTIVFGSTYHQNGGASDDHNPKRIFHKIDLQKVEEKNSILEKSSGGGTGDDQVIELHQSSCRDIRRSQSQKKLEGSKKSMEFQPVFARSNDVVEVNDFKLENGPRSPANYQVHRSAYQRRADEGFLSEREIEREGYMHSLFKQSNAIGEPNIFAAAQKVPKDDVIKLLNFSKSSVGDNSLVSEDPDHYQKSMKKIETLQRRGILPGLNLEKKYLKNLDGSLHFDNHSSVNESLDLAHKIDIYNKREQIKKLCNDSRINDSRKYIINQQSPNFGGQRDEASKSASKINSAMIENPIPEEPLKKSEEAGAYTYKFLPNFDDEAEVKRYVEQAVDSFLKDELAKAQKN